MTRHIPGAIVNPVIRWAMETPAVEVGGFFVDKRPAGPSGPAGPGGAVGSGGLAFEKGENIAEDPSRHFELSAQWMGEMIVEREWKPIALFHSHPSGREEPSADDLRGFPIWYVSTAIILPITQRSRPLLTLYGPHGIKGQFYPEAVFV